MKRPVIEINRDLCNGCGLCTHACAENALALDAEGKAVLVNEIFCDGLGACLDVCPTGALKVVEKDIQGYDVRSAYEHVKETLGEEAARHVHGADTLHAARVPAAEPAACAVPARTPGQGGCPGSMAREVRRPGQAPVRAGAGPEAVSELTQWPVQLRLVSPQAPYFEGADLLIAADCTAFALGSFHDRLLKGRKVVIACPKLDDTGTYVEKLAAILSGNTIYSLTVAIMEVPCCTGLMRMAEQAVEASGKPIAIRRIVVGISGEIK